MSYASGTLLTSDANAYLLRYMFYKTNILSWLFYIWNYRLKTKADHKQSLVDYTTNS